MKLSRRAARIGALGAPWVLGLLIALAPARPAHAVDQPAPHGAAAGTKKNGEPSLSSEQALRAASIARQTMSPFCPGRTLADCPSEYATEWRSDIRKMVAAGFTADQIQAELEKRAGNNLSGIPNRESSYIVPISLSVAAALVLYFVFARLRRPENKVAGTQSKKAVIEKPPSAVDDNRLEAELDRED